MSKLTLALPVVGIFLCSVLAGCGNKGDLYLIPDQISQEDLQQLVLDSEDIPAAEPVDVDDQTVVDDEEKQRR